MTPGERIIEAFGTPARMAELTGIPLPTCYSYKRIRNVPEKRRKVIIDAARKAGIDIGPLDFLPDSGIPRIWPEDPEQREKIDALLPNTRIEFLINFLWRLPKSEMKRVILDARSPEIGLLDDDQALALIAALNLRAA